MRIPLSWLGEYVNVDKFTTEQIADAFIQLGFEVEEIINFGNGLSGPVVIGKVLEIQELTEFKKPIRLCKVQIGPDASSVNEIICGANNFQVGDHVVVALPGAVLPGGFEISARETYGRISNGMICSLRELGIGEDHSGILVVDQNCTVGKDAISELVLADTVLDLSVLPDRGYAMSVRGLARELAGFFELPFKDPADVSAEFVPSNDKVIPGKIEANDSCSVLYLTTMKDFDVSAPTPWNLKRKLILSGMRSISLAVDITNFVMLELGQPLHAFDALKIDREIIVRYGNDKETLTTLDGAKRIVSDQDLVIADRSRALSIAGIMGGADSEISSTTTTIVLEAANFDSARISAAARRYGLTSEAGKRFERGVDPALPKLATIRALNLFLRHGNATILGTTKTNNFAGYESIPFDLVKFESISGIKLDEAKIVTLLEKIGCQVSRADGFLVTIPSWRPDLRDTNDLSEEILRLIGYDQIPMSLPLPKAGSGLSLQQRQVSQIRSYLAANSLAEVLNYPFTSQEQALQFTNVTEMDLVRIANPLSEELPYLRCSLLPGLLQAVQRNLGRGLNNLALFEIGSTFIAKKANKSLSVEFPLNQEKLHLLDTSLPVQDQWLAGIFTGDMTAKSPVSVENKWSWISVVQLLANLLNQFQVPFALKQTDLVGLHPGRSAEIIVDGVVIGRIGELNPRLQRSAGAVDRLIAFELQLSAITKSSIQPVIAHPISAFPIAKEDLSVLVSSEVSGLELIAAVRGLGLSELESAELFDFYQGPQVPDQFKSFTLALRFRASDRTLSAEEISQYKAQILTLLSDQFQATIRT